MRYGTFDDEHREYVITNPKTPVKWINYIGTLEFGGIVDHTGGGIVCKGDPALNRITKYIPQNPASDFKGETLYLRLHNHPGYKVFSPFFVPTLDAYDKYECHVGLSYQRIVSEFYGIRTQVTIFVPLGAHVVVRDIQITNISPVPKMLDVIPVVEYSHFDALKQLTNADWVPQTMTVDAVSDRFGHVIHRQYAFMKKNTAINYFTSNYTVDSWETDRKLFLGDNEYGTWKDPQALHKVRLSNHQARRGDNISALLHCLGTLQPGETRRIVTQLGQAQNIDAALDSIMRFRNPSNVDQAFDALHSFWDGYLATLQAQTPDAAFNSMVNVHNPRQCHTTVNWSRDLSLYQLGFGGRGMGFRDSSQDIMGAMAHMPDVCLALLQKLLSVQKADGSAMHQFYASTMEANEGDSREKPGHRFYGDDHLWVVLAVCAYLKETGTFDLLDQEIPYYEKGVPLDQRPRGTVLDHLERALAFTKAQRGRHGLPLLGFADWNDTVNLPGKAESLFVANQYALALREIIALMEHLGRNDRCAQYQADYEEMREAINIHAWDGDWYVRYFEEDGTPLGSSTNEHGKIYVNSQSWAVLSGVAPEERAHKAMDSVQRLLNTRFGIKLSWPGFHSFDPSKGGITTYPPGAKENGGVFLHTNPWCMIAETMLGRGDQAFQYYQQINPATRNDAIDQYECEPYSYPQNILGNEHPQFGLARNSWLSGTASWTYQAATQYILGVRPTYKGLLIDPCIPRAWKDYTVRRQFRGCQYVVTVHNPKGVCKGVRTVVVDGAALEGNVVPVFQDGATHTVEVTLEA
ncbi:cellobiose phosphorylase [Candidatus Symbiobacter mobilis CR]|uniref:Cellobiose phosphorylase n=2 Tax=Candidatus Symbiobacter TaxID=1436289 RepID=U5NCA4_9BURK|nr:cellobiose phosphorylase [Candidatus Symbiobacter mobilis CR]